MTTHDLKTWPEYFHAVRSRAKPFELRRDDRGYAVGDVLLLREYDPMTPGYTGDVERVRVTYVLRGGEWLAPGYVAMGVETDRVALLTEQLGILRDVARGVCAGLTTDPALLGDPSYCVRVRASDLARLREVAG